MEEKKEIVKLCEEIKKEKQNGKNPSGIVSSLVNLLRTTEAQVDEISCSDFEKKFEIHYQLGMGYQQINKFQLATKHLEKSVLYDDDKKEFKQYVGLSHVYGKIKQFSKAREVLDIANKINSNNSDVKYAYCLMFLRMNQINLAKNMFIVSLKIDPKHEKTLKHIGLLLGMQRKFKEANEHFTKVLEENEKLRNDSMILFNMALNFESLKDYKNAENILLNLIKINPEHGGAITVLIKLYEDFIVNVEGKKTMVKKLKELREKGKYARHFYVRSVKNMGNLTIIGREYFELTKDLVGFGNMKGKLIYVFQVLKQGKPLFRVSCGSYDFTNMLSGGGGGPRKYHLDGYYPGKHKTFAFYNGKPEWEVVKEKVMKIVGDEVQEISSTTNQQNGSKVINVGPTNK